MKTYTEEFKKTIVELYETGNKTKSELAREYGTSECNVRAWIKKYGKIKTSTGGKISKIFIKSNLEVQVILSNKDDEVIKKIREKGYGVTAIEVKGTKNPKYMLYIQIRHNTLENLKKLVRKLDSKAFIVVNETKYVENGYFGVEK